MNNNYYSLSEFLALAGFSRQYLHDRYVKRGEIAIHHHMVGRNKRAFIEHASGDELLARRWLDQARKKFTRKTTTTANAVEREIHHAY